VDSYWRKIKAKSLISGMNWVRSVTNKLSVVPTEKISDERVAGDLVEALERNGHITAERVTVEVDDGLVTLSGWVQDRKAYYEAQNTAMLTAGVLGVKNDLVVY
jgi:osmotically-inducible protein OsmY